VPLDLFFERPLSLGSWRRKIHSPLDTEYRNAGGYSFCDQDWPGHDEASLKVTSSGHQESEVQEEQQDLTIVRSKHLALLREMNVLGELMTEGHGS